MFSFDSDYVRGCHPEVLEQICAHNGEDYPGYGEDEWTAMAVAAVRRRLSAPDAGVFFLVGGTETNTAMISWLLRPHQGVVAPLSGHIAVHESGAIEAAGHKVLTVPSHDGKLDAGEVERLFCLHWNDPVREHTVQPGMIYISQPTELGTLYSKAELLSLREVADRYTVSLFIDGARLAYALAAPENDVALTDYRDLVHAMSLGGTKCGLLFGEAAVFFDPALVGDFRYVVKQQGALLAKGWLSGLQFYTLFNGDLYEKIGAHGIRQAKRLRALFEKHGMVLACASPTNQIFVRLDRRTAAFLKKTISFQIWENDGEDHAIYRFCTSWSTSDQAVDAVAFGLEKIKCEQM